MALFAALVVAGVGLANVEQTKAVKSVEAVSGPAQVEVEITTEAATAPIYSVFPLREPDRLVVDLPGLQWAPGLTTELPAASPQVHQIRVGQFSLEPPITRIVFDLAVPAQNVSYESLVATGEGRLRLRVQEAPAGAGVTKAAGAPINPPPRKTTSDIHQDTTTPAAPIVEETKTPAPTPVEAAETKPAQQPERPFAASAPPVREKTTVVGSTNHPLSYALAAVVVAFAWLGAVWIRKRFRFGQQATTPTITASASTIAQEAFDFEATDIVRCKVVDGYLLVAPERGKEALASLGSDARVQAKGEVTLALSMTGEIAEESETGAKIPTVTKAATSDELSDWAAEAEELVIGLSDEDAVVRKTAARGLRELAMKGHGEVLFSYLRKTDPHVRSVIAAALGEAKITSAGAMLASMTQDTDPSVRAAVMYALGQLGEAAAPYREEVLARIDDSEGIVRARAIEALAAIAPDSVEAASLVTELTGDTDLLVREAAASAAFNFAKHDVCQPLLELLADFTRRAQALEVLQHGEESVLRRLLVAARNADPATAESAMDTLAYVMSRRWTAADFREELSSTDPDIRMAGLEGLSIVGGAEAMKEARRVMGSDPSPEVRARAAAIVSAWDNWMSEETGATAGREREQV